MEWTRLVSATIRSRKSANTLYRLAAVGEVRTRQGGDGRLEFAVEDLDRVAHERGGEPVATARRRRTSTPAA